jgi:hypothetical protein
LLRPGIRCRLLMSVSGPPGGVVLDTDGHPVIAIPDGLAVLDRASGSTELLMSSGGRLYLADTGIGERTTPPGRSCPAPGARLALPRPQPADPGAPVQPAPVPGKRPTSSMRSKAPISSRPTPETSTRRSSAMQMPTPPDDRSAELWRAGRQLLRGGNPQRSPEHGLGERPRFRPVPRRAGAGCWASNLVAAVGVV